MIADEVITLDFCRLLDGFASQAAIGNAEIQRFLKSRHLIARLLRRFFGRLCRGRYRSLSGGLYRGLYRSLGRFILSFGLFRQQPLRALW